jgi:hypothetical protein
MTNGWRRAGRWSWVYAAVGGGFEFQKLGEGRGHYLNRRAASETSVLRLIRGYTATAHL